MRRGRDEESHHFVTISSIPTLDAHQRSALKFHDTNNTLFADVVNQRTIDRELTDGLAPEHAALQLSLIAAQQPAGAALLAAQHGWAHLQAVGRWLMDPAGGALADPPPVEAQEERGRAVDFAGAYTADGQQSPVHQLWCLALSVQGAHCRPQYGFCNYERRASVQDLLTQAQHSLHCTGSQL